MKYSFSATIYKVGVNACVDVPSEIINKMASKGYIPIKGKINEHPFIQTLVPVKNADYQLFVNIPMLKGANAKVTDTVKFIIEKDLEPRIIPMPKPLKQKLEKHNLLDKFKELTSSRQKDILNYLNHLKSEAALMRNVEKVISKLKKNHSHGNK